MAGGEPRIHPPVWPGSDSPSGGLERRGNLYVDPTDGNPIWTARTPAEETPSAGDSRSAPPVEELEAIWQETTGRSLPDSARDLLNTLNEALGYRPSESGNAPEASAAEPQQATAAEQPDQSAAATETAAVTEAPTGQKESAPPPHEETSNNTSPEDPAEKVRAALAEADAHQERLRGLPEWQQAQTVRGAVRHLWRVIQHRAGEKWAALRSDARFQGWWKTLTIRACDGIARLATAAADRLRNARGPLPTAEALLNLRDAAITYSTAVENNTANAIGTGDGDADPSLTGRQRPAGLTPYASLDDAAEVSQRISQGFTEWAGTPMGQELTSAEPMHPKVAAMGRTVRTMREDWRRLPGEDTTEWAGPAAGPFGDVARSAADVVQAAKKSGRFDQSDVQLLQGIAESAFVHAGRLAVTLPGSATPSPSAARQQAAPPRPQVAVPAAATPGPRVSA